MELIFVRHGLPERIENTDGTPADPPLQELGRRQAEAMAAYLTGEHLDAIYASPMNRARQTAQPLEWTTELEASVRDGLAEFDRNDASYIPMDELKKTNYAAWQAMMGSGYTGMGDPLAFQDTVSAAVADIVANHRGHRVAVVCHGGVINAYLAEVLGRDRDDFMFCNVDYASISRVLVASTGQRSVLSINESGHTRSLPNPHGRD